MNLIQKNLRKILVLFLAYNTGACASLLHRRKPLYKRVSKLNDKSKKTAGTSIAAKTETKTKNVAVANAEVPSTSVPPSVETVLQATPPSTVTPQASQSHINLEGSNISHEQQDPVELEPTDIDHDQIETEEVELDEPSIELLLTKAQDLANRMEYEKSIALLTGVSVSGSYETIVNNKIKVYSSSAVGELRNKAAEVYQFARHASGDERTALLQESLTILERAVEKYPQAEQIESIKQNIAKIKKDL